MNEIFNESCLDTMSRMKDNSVDVVITSPPYNMRLEVRKGKYLHKPRERPAHFNRKYVGFDDHLPLEEYNKFHTKVLEELLRVSNLVFYNVSIVTGSKRSVFRMIGDFRDKLKDIIIWDKGVGQPAMQPGVLNRRTELILIFENENPIGRTFSSATFKRGTLDDLWLVRKMSGFVSKEEKGKKYHGATFPESLVEKILVHFTKEKCIIYDPFLGSGTSCVVAKRMGRQWIGSEIDKDYFEFAQKRIDSVKEQYSFGSL